MKEFVDQESPMPKNIGCTKFGRMEEVCGKGKVDNPLGSSRPHCLKSPWQGNFVCYVESIDKLVSEMH